MQSNVLNDLAEAKKASDGKKKQQARTICPKASRTGIIDHMSETILKTSSDTAT